MKENKIIKVLEHSGERIEGKAAKINGIETEKMNITVEISDDKRTLADLDLAVVFGLQRVDENDRVTCMVYGSGNAHDFGKMLNSVRRVIGDRMFMKAVFDEMIIQAEINAADKEDGEEEE